jgi:hypothetical protein
MKIARYLLAGVMCLLGAAGAKAQIELSNGIEMSYPFLFNSSNSKINYGQITFGLRGGIAYKPSQTQFFPILNVSFGRTRLPLYDYNDKDVAVINFNYLGLMLNENYIVNFPQSQLYIYGGIGMTGLFRQGLGLAGKGSGAQEIHLDSTANTNRIFPALNIGFEYVYGESVNRRLYLGIGINFQYTLLLANSNTYYATVHEDAYTYNSFKASMTGNVLSPGFYIALHYMIGHKHSSMYLD